MLCLLWEEGGRRPDDGLLVISSQWSVIRARLAAEAADRLTASADGSFDYAQDDETGVAAEAVGGV